MSTEEISRRGSETSNRPGWRRRCLAVLLIGAAAGGTQGAGVSAGGSAGHGPSAVVGADAQHEAGITGRGVTIALVGAATVPAADSLIAADGHQRLLAVFDAVSSSMLSSSVLGGSAASTGGPGMEASSDLLGAMLSSRRDPLGSYQGIAPNADFVLVRALDSAGDGSAADVVRGIEWVVANREHYGIRVLSLPLIAPPHPGLSGDPLSRAVLQAWAAGIVVVAAAGNGGPQAATISAPGDLPQVITVGAAVAGSGGVVVPSYSAGGPTLRGFVKPEVVAPAGMVEVVAVPPDTGRVRLLPAGTSISSAMVSGVAALILEASPWLSPDEVKQRLVASARPAAVPFGDGPSVLRQGAGLVDPWAAVGGDDGSWVDDGLAGRGLIWSGGSARGLLWSGGSARGLLWHDLSAPGLLRSETSVRGLLWHD